MAEMTPDLSPAEVARLKDLCEKATPNWRHSGFGGVDDDTGAVARFGIQPSEYDQCQRDANADFAAAARTALPLLIAQLAAQRERAERLEAELAEAQATVELFRQDVAQRDRAVYEAMVAKNTAEAARREAVERAEKAENRAEYHKEGRLVDAALSRVELQRCIERHEANLAAEHAALLDAEEAKAAAEADAARVRAFIQQWLDFPTESECDCMDCRSAYRVLRTNARAALAAAAPETVE